MMTKVIGAGSILLALTVTASAEIPAGGEFRVNTYTPGHQLYARPAMEPDGDFVVVWSGGGQQDGDQYGVFGQRFAASGDPRGSEFQISSYTTENQIRPAVAVGSGGDFVVVWESVQDGSFNSIQGQRFDAAGSAIGGEFQVNTYTTGYQSRPDVGLASDGRFVVTWTSVDGSSKGISARRFDATGNPVAGEFLVNAYTTGYQMTSAIAVEANGTFVAVWQDLNYRDGSGSAIFGQRYDASANRLGSEFQVNTHTLGFQRLPSVSVSPLGGFVVAWTGPGDGFTSGVFSRRFDASGNPVGEDFVVNSDTTTGSNFGGFGQVAHDALGNFVVTWQGPDNTTSYPFSYGVLAQRFSASGARLGAEFRANTFTPSTQGAPSVASDSAGNFVVVWNSAGQDGSGYGIYAQRYGDDLIFEDGFDPIALSP